MSQVLEAPEWAAVRTGDIQHIVANRFWGWTLDLSNVTLGGLLPLSQSSDDRNGFVLVLCCAMEPGRMH